MPDRQPGEAETLPRSRETTAAPRLELRVVAEGGREVDRTVVLDGDFFRIGSHPSNHLVLDDPRVSRFHCHVERASTAWRVSDAGSKNGTFVAGVRVREADLPSPECTLELGDSRVLVLERPAAVSAEVLEQASFGELYGRSLPMRKLFALLDRVSRSEANVLIEAESGTGKELVASEIVRRGPRAKKPFIIVDGSAISPALFESELFGHVKGAFTGAERDRVGAFEAANGGTVFLDEIGEMPLEMQPKLLRALEAREIRRVGETKTRSVDVRVIAATNRRLDREVNEGRFREDLFFRLSVVRVRIPPLRDRVDDLELLVNVFLEALGAQTSRHLFTPEVLAEMKAWEWPGNVRELRNYVERAVIFGTAGPAAEHAAAGSSTAPPAPIDLDVSFREAKEDLVASFERRYLAALMDWAEGNVSRAARKAKMDRMNLHRLVQRYNLKGSGSLRD
ncbi:MAG: sigma 54-interacting transcriptional regulator [Myxococcales bacterium]|jgi:transcriptional regulator with GAF, ATPase, and Fis domain|nr:sigma 54-interacting transcriptional regulator [Myxococcales bacterium]